MYLMHVAANKSTSIKLEYNGFSNGNGDNNVPAGQTLVTSTNTFLVKAALA